MTMIENNNDLAGKLPKTPYPELKKLQPLVGKWKITGDNGLEATSHYEWMEGGFFLIHHFDLTQGEEKHKGVEYIGFNEATQTLRSRLMETNGSNFSYTYDIEGHTFWYWFGDRGSGNYSKSTFNEDFTAYEGKWQWPNADGSTGGYSFKAEKID
jgi:hypothetical protein